jgi:hypothetical protein
MIKAFLLLSSIVLTIQQSFNLEHLEVRRSIIDSYMEGSPKELFKVFHLVFEKPYNLNSEAAIAKYRVFKKNLSMIKEHNASGKTWTLEVNFFADMTKEEVKAYMGLKPVGDADVNLESLIKDKNFDLFDDLVEREERRKLKELSFFDEFADNDDEPVPPKGDDDEPIPPKQNNTYAAFNHFAYLTPARSQGNCGSCWAFATACAIEGNYNIARNRTYNTEYISPQAILDCNPEKDGCEGGWMNTAIRHVARSGAVRERDYPYESYQKSCRNVTRNSDIIFNRARPFDGCAWTRWFESLGACTKDSFYKILQKGPATVVLNADDNFTYYRSGVLDGTKIPGCNSYNHAVVAFAWTYENDKSGARREVISIRNSWGPFWGERGNIKYFYDDQGSCFITKLAFRPNLI